MNPRKIALSAAAAVLALASCSGGDETSTLPDGANSTPPTTSAAPTLQASATPGPTGESPAGTTSAVSLTEACQAAVEDQAGALAQLQSYMRNPLNSDVSVQDLNEARMQLQADMEMAPEPLREELKTQVAVLETAVDSIQDRNIKSVDVAEFQAAGARITGICETIG